MICFSSLYIAHENSAHFGAEDKRNVMCGSVIVGEGKVMVMVMVMDMDIYISLVMSMIRVMVMMIMMCMVIFG